MANFYYNDHLVIAFASLNPSDKQWSAGAEITWKVDGQRRSHSVAGLPERFESSDAAEGFVVNLAEAWIDAQRCGCAGAAQWLGVREFSPPVGNLLPAR